MSSWIEAIKRILGRNAFIAIIGNKCLNFTHNISPNFIYFISGDLEHQRKVRLDITRQFMERNNFNSYLVSAKSGEGVRKLYTITYYAVLIIFVYIR